MSASSTLPQPGPRALSRLAIFLAVLGPGLVVMLADTDVGSVITAAQSGAQWGYQLLSLQLVLIPILYVVQELTVRLGIFTGKGHGELIRETFGARWAWVSVAGLAVASVGAIITEFSGVAGVGALFGVPRGWSLGLAAFFLLAVVWTGSYRRVERIAIALGLFEMVFVWVAFRAPIDGAQVLQGLGHVPVQHPAYWYLVAANIGAVIMPWMVFYQQSAVADKGLKPEQYTAARWDTAVGAVLTQLIMAAVLMVTAAVLWSGHSTAPLNTVGQIAQALTPTLGETLGRTVFGLGILGAAMVAAIVVALAAAWGFGEVTGYKHSLELHPRQAPWFYTVFSAGVIGGALVVAFVPDLVALSIGVEVMNALMLPLVLGFLVALATKALPPEHRLRGAYFWVVVAVVVLTAGLGVYGGLSSLV
ncbi:NRAMP family divalent metal transporter [Thiomonas arsenitoxydans]|jgi:NRAMP (natural resistance-associated macrophage protein)-like metal ion transporter|uniref:NRAMP family divalent metal transporter n=1 Tax=Thiomonas arsenitoxydans (strain DSM 22701 / CIP 110005 / 3As) TaxID=426114 RepID=UPI001AD32146|nr:divalent metal cation transporter [Thiomonas arsenitoxydans]MBN8775397.1 divalent metal cation transporter [Thiomonas arsenitoxydans]